MPPVISDLLTPVEYAQELLDLSAAAVADANGAIARQYLWTGRPAFDCEQLVVSGWSFGEAGTAVTTTTGVGRRHVHGRVNLVGFLVTVVRECAPLMRSNVAPDEDELTAHASIVISDVWSIWTRVYQTMRAGDLFGGKCSDLFFDGARPLDSEGGLSAWEIEFRAEIMGIVASGS